ncbi:MAG: hypothetical protein J6R04_02720 [Clostridia bacterium]|nr:hypothetical protein [Clostridia bacterium]
MQPFFPVHPDLLDAGIPLPTATYYGMLESKAKCSKPVYTQGGEPGVVVPNEDAARKLQLSPKTVKKVRKELANRGLIRTIKRPYGLPSITIVYGYEIVDASAPAHTPSASTMPSPTVPIATAATEAHPPMTEATSAPAADIPEGSAEPPCASALEGEAEASTAGASMSPSVGTAMTSPMGTFVPPPLKEKKEGSFRFGGEVPPLKPHGQRRNVMLTNEQYHQLREELGEYADAYIDHVSERLSGRPYFGSHVDLIRDWWEQDGPTFAATKDAARCHPQNGSFDTADFFGDALKRSLGDILDD